MEAAPGEPSGPPPDAMVWLKVSASRGRGGWAARIRDGGDGGERDLSGSEAPVSANRLDLLAAAEILESLPEGARIALHTGSDYLRNGATTWVAAWRRRGWKTKEGKPVANREEWERLAAAAARRRVDWPRLGAGGEEEGETMKVLEQRACEAREGASPGA